MGGKIEQKSIKNGIEKTIEKRRAARWPTRRSKSLRGCAAPPGRGGRGRGKPLPRGLKIERLKTKHRYPTLNHPSPEGWWD